LVAVSERPEGRSVAMLETELGEALASARRLFCGAGSV
jgi:hypothetical protein